MHLLYLGPSCLSQRSHCSFLHGLDFLSATAPILRTPPFGTSIVRFLIRRLIVLILLFSPSSFILLFSPYCSHPMALALLFSYLIVPVMSTRGLPKGLNAPSGIYRGLSSLYRFSNQANQSYSTTPPTPNPTNSNHYNGRLHRCFLHPCRFRCFRL
jgi:hypothetical protein